MRELSDKECDVIIDEARDGCNDGFVRLSYVYVRAGYAAGYRAAKAEQTSGKGVIGSPPGHTEGQKMPGPLDPCPNYGAMPPSLDRQPAATPSASVRDDAQHGAASAAQADAARYRWLRGGAPSHSERWSRWNLQRWDGSSWHSLERTALDAAIDTAMKGEGDA